MSTISFQNSPEAGMISPTKFLKIMMDLVDSTDGLPTVKKTSYTGEEKTVVTYYNIPAAFDIEVSSFYYNDEKQACMYVWQFGILNWVTYGRTWAEFLDFMEMLTTILSTSESKRLICYIHNFAYEFQFIRRLFSWTKIFFLDKRKPVYGITGDPIPGIEFRCSLKLSSKSLAKVGEDLQKYKVRKKEGDLDYQLIRTPDTPLTEKELGYCENDIRVLLSYIQEKIESDGSIAKIPLTNTGYVREYCRTACFKYYKSYRGLMKSLKLRPDEYSQLKQGFAGGFTHANASFVAGGRKGTIQQEMKSYDFTSSYPAVMVLEQFPMSEGRLIHLNTIKNPMQVFKQCLHKYCCLIDCTFYNIREKPNMRFEHPLSVSKCYDKHDVEEDNGRVVSAIKLRTTITEQDWFTLCDFYDVESFTIEKLRIYKKSYLPKVFVQSILDLYKRKTVLKDVEGEEVNYMISKNMLNSAYGMCVTDIVRDEILFDNDSYDPRETFRSEKQQLEKAIDKYNNGGKRFLFYPWGVWVTAYARRNLFSGIKECRDDYVYADTDSIKILHPERHARYFEEYNKKILEKINEAAKFQHIDPSEFSPLTKEGKVKTIGVWDDDGEYWYFKTLGAKRYLIRNKRGYKLTVAGLHKHNAMDYLLVESTKQNVSPFELFTTDLCVPPEHSGRLTHTYCDSPCEGNIVDYLGNSTSYHEESYIHMEPSSYDMSISDVYDDFLNQLLGEEEIFFG